MDRQDLIPARHRAERTFLLDLLAGHVEEVQFGRDLEVAAFLEVTPAKLLPFVHLRLQPHAERLRAPASLLDKLRAHHRRNVLVALRRAADLRRLDATLGAAGIPFVVLKGPVLAAMVYPEPAARPMIDLDLLIAEADLARARAALAAIGYQVPGAYVGARLAAGEAPPLQRAEPGGPALELHFMLDSLPEERDPLAILSPAIRRLPVGHGLELPALAGGELFAHVVTHASRHHRFEGQLRSLVDVALLVHALGDELDWGTLDREWERRGIAQWIALTVCLAHILLRAPWPAAYRPRLAADEAMAIAAEQLWIQPDTSMPMRVVYALARRSPTPVHAGVAGVTVPVPPGARGARARAEREWLRARRLGRAIWRGRMWPRAVARDVELFRKRERLFALTEGTP